MLISTTRGDKVSLANVTWKGDNKYRWKPDFALVVNFKMKIEI